MTTISITVLQDGGFRVSFGYDPELAKRMKAMPRSARSYDPGTKTWTLNSRRHLDAFMNNLPFIRYTIRVRHRRGPNDYSAWQKAYADNTPPKPPPRRTPREEWSSGEYRASFHDDFWEDLRRAAGGYTHTSQSPPPRTPPKSRAADSGAVGTFLASVPPDLRSKAYRALSKVFHPDTGGSEELMKALNSAWERHKP